MLYHSGASVLLGAPTGSGKIMTSWCPCLRRCSTCCTTATRACCWARRPGVGQEHDRPVPLSAQAFHVLYHSDESVLLGAPTGSGKTISAELAMLRAFSAHPGAKVIYIAPLKV